LEGWEKVKGSRKYSVGVHLRELFTGKINLVSFIINKKTGFYA